MHWAQLFFNMDFKISLVSFFCVLFFSILLFFCHYQYFTLWFLFSIASFQPSIGFDNVQSLQRLPASSHVNIFLLLSFFCLFFHMSHWSKGWKVLGMCCYDYDFFFTNF